MKRLEFYLVCSNVTFSQGAATNQIKHLNSEGINICTCYIGELEVT